MITGEQPSVLLIEDDAATREAFKDGLESYGYSGGSGRLQESRHIQVLAVFSEGDLFEGLRAGSLDPSVIMLSATFTERPVPETISQIKELKEDIPVVVVTANSTAELERGVRRVGIFYYMTLPARRDEIQQVTLSALRAAER